MKLKYTKYPKNPSLELFYVYIFKNLNSSRIFVPIDP